MPESSDREAERVAQRAADRTTAAMAVLGERGWGLLVAAGFAFDESGGDVLRTAALLAKRRPDDPGSHRAVALELVAEGARLSRKIGAFERLLAVRGAVEQATSGRVATWHAQRVPEGARVVEIGCGCGGDTLALAHRARNLIATDTDPVRAACAHMNLAALGLSNARAIPGDGFDVLAGEGRDADVVFADPDRRPGGERTLDPEGWSPPLSGLAALARTPGRPRRVLVKAAPSLDPETAPDFDVAYVSCGGECVEAFLESHAEPETPQRIRAVLLPPDGPSIELEGDRGDAPAGSIGAALLVPDPAAIRSRLLAELCSRHGATLVDDGIAWLTGPAGVVSPWLSAHTIVARCGIQDVPAELRRLGATSIRVHVRGVPVTASEVEAKWRKPLPRPSAPDTGHVVVDVFVSRFLGRPGVVLTRDSRP
ncbi:MAG: class I SAM-dependent methyltransferase [Planctomycetes bacterium]|nr:class I SAM-dependent methyltransferase [Planctomycetota bacterium]